ncbi:MAG: hypothetical protein WA880_16285 [Ornithinimicrobium sp.]
MFKSPEQREQDRRDKEAQAEAAKIARLEQVRAAEDAKERERILACPVGAAAVAMDARQGSRARPKCSASAKPARSTA